MLADQLHLVNLFSEFFSTFLINPKLNLKQNSNNILYSSSPFLSHSLILLQQVHLSECHGNSETEIVLKPHKTSDTDPYYKTEFYRTRKNYTMDGGEEGQTTGASVVPWEDVLKHTAYLTLSERLDEDF